MKQVPMIAGEGGITSVSLENAETLIKRFGLPTRVELYWDKQDWACVDAAFEGYGMFHFTGFSWGYGGEGPNGLAKFFKMLKVWPPITINQIAKWPDEERFTDMTFIRGEDYGQVEAMPVTGPEEDEYAG